MRWVVFDYGEVISRRTNALPALARHLEVPLAEFDAAYWAHRDAFDRGCPTFEYWQRVGAELGVSIDEKHSAELSEVDNSGWLYTDQDAMALLAELDQAGVPLALLSNAPATFGRAAERQPWARHFRQLMFSGDLGIAKPDPEIWAALTERLAAPADNCLFVDDRQVNVDAARQAGLHAQRWTSAGQLRAQLTEFIGSRTDS